MSRRRERPPLLALSAGAVAALFFLLPLAGLVWRAPWRSVGSDLGAADVRTALRLSLEASLAAVALCLLFGLPLAWVLARLEFPGRRLLRALTILPMVLPPVVGGIALINAFGRRGLVGPRTTCRAASAASSTSRTSPTSTSSAASTATRASIRSRRSIRRPT